MHGCVVERRLSRRPPTNGRDEFCAATSAQGCNDADAGSTGTRNRDRNARTPFRSVSRVEDAFTHGRPLGPYLPTVVESRSRVSTYTAVFLFFLLLVAQLHERIPSSSLRLKSCLRAAIDPRSKYLKGKKAKEMC